MSKKVLGPKAKAWEEFSRWVRVRDCVRTSSLPFTGTCITCGMNYHIRFLQAGHCYPGRRNARLFQEELVNAQCRICNEYHHGKRNKYERVMIDRYGKKQVEKWKKEGLKVIHDRDMDFPGKAKKYRDLTTALLRKHGRYASYEDMLGSSD